MHVNGGRMPRAAGVIACAAAVLIMPAQATARDVQVVGAGDPAAQAKVLRGCLEGGGATCRFTPEKPRTAAKPAVAVGKPLVNCTDQVVQRRHRYAHRIAPTNSVGLAGLNALAAKAVQARYGRQVTRPYTFHDTVTVPIPPGSASTVRFRDPVNRFTGDWLVSAGGGTWDVRDVEFDFPRYPLNVLSDLNAFAGIVLLHNHDLTPAQRRACTR